MTLSVVVVTGDGIVVAADSRTTIRQAPAAGGSVYRVGSDFTHKVFQAGEVAVATFGEAFVQGRSIASHMSEFVARENDHCTNPKAAADHLAAFFSELYSTGSAGGPPVAPPDQRSALGFLVAGYADAIGEAYEVGIPGGFVNSLGTTASGGTAAWRGQADVVTRIVRGADLDLLEQMAIATGKQAEHEALKPVLGALTYRIPLNLMNLQDAVDFAVLCIRTTIDVQRLTLGSLAMGQDLLWPGVGGPIEIATVTAQDKFAWLQRTAVQGERPAGQAEGHAS